MQETRSKKKQNKTKPLGKTYFRASSSEVRGSLGSLLAQVPVQPLREVPQRWQEVAQVDLVLIAQVAGLGKEKRKCIRAGSTI